MEIKLIVVKGRGVAKRVCWWRPPYIKYTIYLEKFWHDPYPDLAVIQVMAPVVYTQQLYAALITRRADIFTQ